MSRTMMPNYRVEAEIREAALRAGALECALDDFVEDWRNYAFDESEMRDHIEKMKATKPHRFAIAGADEAQEAIDVFTSNSLQKRADFVKRHGQQHAEQTAALFNTSLASTKAGTIPEHLQKFAPGDHSRGKDNPWSPTDGRGLPTTDKAGRFLPAQVTKQMSLVRTLIGAHGQVEGMRRATEIAKAAGCRVGDVRAASRAA